MTEPLRDKLIRCDWVNRDGAVMYPAWWQPLPDHPPLEGENTTTTPSGKD